MTTDDDPDIEILAEGQHLRMVSRAGWEYVERPLPSGIICVAALTDANEIVLVEQTRPPVAARVIELPAGLVGDHPGKEEESLLEGARRELLEETGYEADEWHRVAEGPPSAGITTEILNLYVARGLRKVEPGGGDESEDIIVHVVPLATIHDWLQEAKERGAMIDLKIFAGLYFVAPSFADRPPRRRDEDTESEGSDR